MWQLLKDGDPFIILLLLASVTALTVIIERGMALRWARVAPEAIRAAFERARTLEDIRNLGVVCQNHPSPVGRLFLAIIDHGGRSFEESVDAAQTKARAEIAALEKGLVLLEICVGIAPLLGLVGTINGLVTLFGGFGQAVAGDSALLAKGISVALNATLMGLLVAIPSLVAWSYYNRRVDVMTIEMEQLCDELARRQRRLAGGAEPKSQG